MFDTPHFEQYNLDNYSFSNNFGGISEQYTCGRPISMFFHIYVDGIGD